MKFICVGKYDDYIGAYIVLGRLQSEEINCWLQNENMVTVFPALTHAVGGIKLMVAEAQADRAVTLLAQWQNEDESGPASQQ